MAQLKFKVNGMSCAACVAHVEKAVRDIDGVSDVSVSLLTNSMTLNADKKLVSKICAAVAAAGYSANLDDGSTDLFEENKNETKKLLKRLIISVAILLPLMYLSMGHVMWGWWLPSTVARSPFLVALLQFVLTTAVLIVNKKFFINGTKSVLTGGANMDTLVALGSGAAYLYGIATTVQIAVNQFSGNILQAAHGLHDLYFESAAMILTLVTVGKTLEAYSKGKTTDAVKSLKELAPDTAILLKDGKEIEVKLSEVKVLDIFVLHPGSTVPVDGVVIDGESAINEAALTGESIPVDKTVGDTVNAATLNLNGYLVCKATTIGADTALGKIIKTVEDAAATKAPVARIADKVSAVFVPSVVAIALVTFIVWLLLGEAFGFALARAISVLVISCPCALGLATPVAIMVGSGVGAKQGILFKTATALEIAGKTDIVVLDKTGTVTQGKPVVTDIIPFGNKTSDELLYIAAALEAKSEHPLAHAVMEKVKELGVPVLESENFERIAGSGVKATINGEIYLAANGKAMSEKGFLGAKIKAVAENLADEGKTPLFFANNTEILGVIAVADSLKPESATVVKNLRKMGVQVALLTGDNKRTANAIAKSVGIKNVVADLLPNGKFEIVSKLSKQGKVMMVGDGINDAPSLKGADCGVAIGAGTDVAIDAADVVLMRSSLSGVCEAISLSRQTLKDIKENLFWAFIYNCIGIPVAAGVLIPFGITLSPMLGAAAMSMSSVCVVLNALRLNLFNTKKIKSVKKQPIELNLEMVKEQMKMKKVVIIDGMMCEHCAARVKDAFIAVAGIEGCEINLAEKSATITSSAEISNEIIADTVKAAGYTLVEIK